MAAAVPGLIVTPINNAATQPLTLRPANNLWDKALQTLDEEDKANINFNTNKLDILNDILAAATEKQRLCREKCWKYKKGNKEIIIRDQLEKIIAWVDKFKQIGDQIVQYDPGHAALPWAGVRFFLQWTVNDTQLFGAMAEEMEFISDIITRYAIFEKLYLRTSAGSATKAEAEVHLNEALCKLYAAVLQFLSKAKRYYSRTTTERLFKAAIDGQSNLDRYINRISKAKTEVEDYVRLVDSAQSLTNSDDAQKLRTLLLQLNDPINRSAVLLSDIHDSLKESERRNLLKWLSTIQHVNHHKTMGKDILSGSGNWLLLKKEFVEWRKESSSSILWLHGIPGSGKSKLIFSVIEHINKERSSNRSPAPIGYFYCVRNTSEPERADPDEIMRSILKQLSSSTSTVAIREPVAAKYKELKMEADETGCLEPSKLTITECEALILELLKSNPATIVIDALDECDPDRRHELLEALDNIIQQSSNVVNIFVSSRDDNDIVCQLEDSPNVIINATDNGKDIQGFIVSQIDHAIKKKRLLSGRVSDELKQQIINVLTAGAQGMFRWVSLQLQNVCDPQRMKHEGDIKAELGKLPKTLNDSYQVIFERIANGGETSRNLADRALKWLLCSKCRLSSLELIAAITINPNGECIPLNQRELLDTCCNLLVLDEELNTFRFAHLSVREYLEQSKMFNKIEANGLVAQRCIDVYMLEQQDLSDSAMKQNEIIKSYAVVYWPFHCENLGNSPADKVKDHIRNFLLKNSHPSPLFQKWCLDITETDFGRDKYLDYLRLRECFSSPSSLLFLTTCFALTWLMHDLNQLKNVSWHQLNYNGNSGLILAVKWGSKEIVQLLLEREDIDVNLMTRDDETPLSLAAERGDEAMLRLLLGCDRVDVNLEDGDWRTPLAYAVQFNYETAVRLLLERDDIHVNLKAGSGNTPVLLAALYGNEEIMRLLLERDDVDVNSKNMNGQTPLAMAVKDENEKIIRLLLERDDVDVNSKNMNGETPLAIAAYKGNEEIMRLLLERDEVDINSKCEQGKTALRYAVEYGKEAIVKLLLERDGVDVNFKDIRGMTPLAAAAWKGDGETIRLLLERDEVDINSKNMDNWTPLTSAAYMGRETVLRLLLERDDVDVDCKNSQGFTARDMAEQKEYTEIVRLLDLHKERGKTKD